MHVLDILDVYQTKPLPDKVGVKSVSEDSSDFLTH